MKKLDIDTKDFFSQLDEDTIKKAKKKDKKDKKKKKDKDPFGYDFDTKKSDKKKHKKKEFDDTNSKKDKKKKNDKYKDSFDKKDKKDKKKKKDKESMLGDSTISKKVLKGIKSNELREQFKKQKVLIDNKKFWNKD